MSAPAFGEIGAGVGFEPVTVRTMGLINPRIATAFEKCSQGNTITDPPTWFTVRVGDQRKAHGKIKDEAMVEHMEEAKKIKSGRDTFVMPARRGPRYGVHRAELLDELIKLVPGGITRFRKKLVDVTAAGKGLGRFSNIHVISQYFQLTFF